MARLYGSELWPGDRAHHKAKAAESALDTNADSETSETEDDEAAEQKRLQELSARAKEHEDDDEDDEEVEGGEDESCVSGHVLEESNEWIDWLVQAPVVRGFFVLLFTQKCHRVFVL